MPKQTKRKQLRVLELSHAVAGPTVSQILADYGAEVIKVERPQGGDIFRNVPGMGASMFLAVNRGKKSLALELKSKEGLQLFYALLKQSDVLVENLSPGASEKLGVSYAKARRVNPRLVYCKVESFGKGPMEQIPAFDPVLQAATGIMSTTGFPPDQYARAGVSIVDMSTGMHGALAVLFLLLQRVATGKGGLVQIPLYDAAAYYMCYWLSRFDLTGKDTSPLGSTHIFGSPYNLFRAKGGFLYIAVAGDEAWKSLCEHLQFQDLAILEKYSSSQKRVEHKEELEAEVGKRLAELDIKLIQEKLANSRVPFSVLHTVQTLAEDDHFLARKLVEKYSFEGKRFRSIVNPALVNGVRLHARGNPPRLGEHTRKVLRTVLQLSREEIRKLEQNNVVKSKSS